MLKIIDLSSMHLSGVSLEVASGQCVSVAGPSGSGKSTLLRAIADLDVHEGQVFCDDVAQDAIPAHAWRKRVGYLPAESAWWFDTVREHFADVDLAMFDALHLREALLDSQVSRLSSGEKQRLSLVRLLSRRPQVLLLDEPTANLDDSARAAVEQLIERYRRETQASVVWVGHDLLQLQRIADQHYIIDGNTLKKVTAQ